MTKTLDILEIKEIDGQMACVRRKQKKIRLPKLTVDRDKSNQYSFATIKGNESNKSWFLGRLPRAGIELPPLKR